MARMTNAEMSEMLQSARWSELTVCIDLLAPGLAHDCESVRNFVAPVISTLERVRDVTCPDARQVNTAEPTRAEEAQEQ